MTYVPKNSINLNSQSFKNKIINGDMRIAQRGTSFATNSGYTLDRWFMNNFGTTAAITVTQNSDVPSDQGFQNSLKIQVNTAYSTFINDNTLRLKYMIEGYNFKPLVGKNTVLSFWVKAYKTGTYSAAVMNTAGDRCYVSEFVINTSATWEKKSISLPITFSGGTWDYTNGIGLILSITLGAGPTMKTSSLNQWLTGNYVASSNQVNGVDSTSNYFNLTGVQLEESLVATPFEFRNISQELIYCQRYYEKSIGTSYENMFQGNVSTGQNYRLGMLFNTQKRSTPICTYANLSGDVGFNQSAPTAMSANIYGHAVYKSAIATNVSAYYYFSWTADAEL